MSEVYTYNATHLVTVRDGTVELTQSADHGSVGSGHLALDDTAGTQVIVGQKDFSVNQDACSRPLLWRGYVSVRTYGRDAGVARAPDVGASRGIQIELVDLNAILAFRLIDGSDGNRPIETVNARMAWLIGSAYLSGLVIDNGRIASSASGMDAADYRYQHAGDVLADMATAAPGFNYHVQDYGSGPELIFRDENASTADASTLRISNVLSDASSVTLNPFTSATLTRDPSRVISKMAYSYRGGTIVQSRAATATTFNGERSGTASNSDVKTAAAAILDANSQLFQLSTEEDLIECTVLATDAQVNLMPAGWRIQGKFSQLTPEGYGSSFTYFRIVEITKKQIVPESALYEVTLKLSPQEAAQPAAGIVQSTFARANTSEVAGIFANPLTIGNKLLVFVVTQAGTSALPGAPLTGGPLDFWGAGAWTRLNGATRTAVDLYFDGTDELYDGLAAYYKTIDATTQGGTTPDNTVGAWELTSTADLAGATLIYKDVQTTSADPSVFNAGSLGTVAVGQLAMYCVIWQNNVNAGGPAAGYGGDWIPMTAVAPGDFTEVWYHGQTDTSYGPYPATYSPMVWMGQRVGTGSTVAASIQKAKNPRNGFPFNAVGWAAIGIKIST